MAAINSRMAAAKWTLVGMLVITVCLLTSITYAKTETTKTREIFHIIKIEMVEVGDVSGHVIGFVEQRGLVFTEDGEVGTYAGWITFDYTNGNGKHEGYGVTTYEDGSTHLVKAQGKTTTAKGGKFSLFEGTFKYIGGSGRFQGIEGSGSYTGKRVAPLEAGADAYLDLTSTYTLPSK